MSLEMACVYFSDGKCTKFSEPGYVSYCSYGPCGYEKLSNGDKIRSMSDYDLADWIADILNHCDNKKPEDECLDSCPLYSCCNLPFDSIEGWLKSPADKEGEG